jgi:hypothetical protein
LAGINLVGKSQVLQYSRSLVDTYSFVVTNWLEKTKDLRILEHCSFDSCSDLPSWIPDWRIPVHAPVSDWQRNNSRASAHTSLFYQTLDKVLHLKGFIFDVANIFPPVSLNNQDSIDISSLLSEAERLNSRYRPTNEPSKTALVRTVHADLAPNVQEAYVYLFATPEEQKDLDLPLAYPVVKDVNALDMFVRSFFVKQRRASKYAFTGRKYFQSRTGYIGLVPDATQEGDKICVFFGGDTPFVIRPSGDQYLLIGACYVHGIMKGEAMVEFEDRVGVPENFFII